MKRSFDIKVPGRVCLFGEHSDWAGSYRRFNSEIPPGQVIIAGTNQGIHARVRAHPDRLVLRSVLPDGRRMDEFSVPMERAALAREAEAGGFYSYAAGVAHYMLTFYQVHGLEIDNYQTTLPVKKGLSSSAAMCVLTARAFNKVYDLKLTVRAEMEAAYQGEIRTPSRCGRMDQGCAYGQGPVLMSFDGDFLGTRQITVGAPLHLLVGDLRGSKDTIQILADLTRAYPFAKDEASRQAQEYLGRINTELVRQAGAALAAGDAAGLGALMTRAQAEFDRCLAPLCPAQLTAPKLHAVLADPRVAELAFGGKGVGSQGDGCVQFVARDPQARAALAAHLRQKWGMDCFELDLKPPQQVRKAVIPAAGFGTRMYPASKAVKKEFFPVVAADGLAKPIILMIAEEADRAGIEQIAMVVRPEEKAAFEAFFHTPVSIEHYNRLPEKAKKYSHYLLELGERISFILQEQQEGFGHAVHCAKNWVGNEPFLLMLGDHLYGSDTDECCARQLITAFEANDGRGVVGMYEAEAAEVSNYGTMSGVWLDEARRLMNISEFAEKPSIDYARNNLAVEGLPPDRFMCVYGQYVLPPAIFRYLEAGIAEDQRLAGEIQLTTALDAMRRGEGMLGYRVAGQHYDTGLPLPYVRTLQAVAGRKPLPAKGAEA